MSVRNTHLSVDEFVDLANGLMDRDDAVAAMAHVRSCQLCEEGLQEVSGARERARASGPPRARRRPRRQVLLPAGLLAAASIALFFWLSAPESPEPFWLPVVDRTNTMRSGGGASVEDYERGLAAYDRRDAEEALRALEFAQVPEEREPERLLYLASARQLTGDCEGCLDALEQMEIALIPQPDRDRARWIQALCLLGLGRDAEAEAVLNTLESSVEFGARARAELERISDQRR